MSPVSLPDLLPAQPVSGEECTVAECFSRQAARTPDRTAVIAGDRRLTFRELEAESNRLARHLRALGLWPGTLAGLAVERSAALLPALLGILKAGAAYVPLDVTYPRERLAFMMEDSAMPVVLASAQTREHLPSGSGGPRIVDIGDSAVACASAQPFASGSSAADLAYVIYTSGSTGRPKGVMIESRNLLSFFQGMDEALGGQPGVWLAVTSICFDISVLELLWTLTRGSTVVLHPGESSFSIPDAILRHHVTHLQMTPSLARMLTLDPRALVALGSLQQLLLGGEALPPALLEQLRPALRGDIFNMYGPTETTIWSTACRLQSQTHSVPIGRPIAGTTVHLLDEQLHAVAPGESGEICIGGEGVGRGYWNRPQLTAERFVSLPALSPGRLYRTGDLARLLPDGNLEFLGRGDDQIKLRGHRIEPAEIEAALEACSGIHQAVVIAREDRAGDRRLVAYLVAEAGVHAAPPLREQLQAMLPDFMVPSCFVSLPALPLTGNGKIDRRALLALPPPELAAASSAAPAGELEGIVACAWQEALGIACVSRDDNFFDLGAHSLTVAEVHARLQAQLGRAISLLDLFQFSTVRALAAHLGGQAQAEQHASRAQRRRAARRP